MADLGRRSGGERSIERAGNYILDDLDEGQISNTHLMKHEPREGGWELSVFQCYWFKKPSRNDGDLHKFPGFQCEGPMVDHVYMVT